MYKCKGERGEVLLWFWRKPLQIRPHGAEFPSLTPVWGEQATYARGHTAYELWDLPVRQGVQVTAPRNSQEGEGMAVSAVLVGEVVSTSESCLTKLGRPCTCPVCPMKAVTPGPRLGWKSVSVISLKDSLHQRSLNVSRTAGAGAEAGPPVRGSRLVCLYFSPTEPSA